MAVETFTAKKSKFGMGSNWLFKSFWKRILAAGTPLRKILIETPLTSPVEVSAKKSLAGLNLIKPSYFPGSRTPKRYHEVSCCLEITNIYQNTLNFH